MEIQITYPVEPTPKLRPRFGQGRAYTPKKTAAFERLIQMYTRAYMAQKDVQTLKGPLKLSLCFFTARPRKPKYRYPATRPDIDNLAKAIMDALNGILWADDNQVVYLTTRKLYADGEPNIMLWVENLE